MAGSWELCPWAISLLNSIAIRRSGTSVPLRRTTEDGESEASDPVDGGPLRTAHTRVKGSGHGAGARALWTVVAHWCARPAPCFLFDAPFGISCLRLGDLESDPASLKPLAGADSVGGRCSEPW